MTDEDPLGDIAEQMAEIEADDADADTVDETATETTGEEATDEPDPLTEPAFTHDETKQRAIYPRKESWGTWEQMRTAVTYKCQQNGLQSVTKAEIDEAAVQIASGMTDEIAEWVTQERERSE